MRCQPGTARNPHLEAIWNPNHQKPGGGVGLFFEVKFFSMDLHPYYKHAFRFKNFLSQQAKIIIVEFYVLSNLNYCDILFQNLSGVLKNKLQKLQNWCIRFIFRQRKFDHISPYFKKLNTLNMEQRRSLHNLT